MRKLSEIFLSFKLTLTLLATLGIGAAVATFIENDYGTSTARVLVYNNIWYETILVLTCLNLLGVIIKFKMWKHPPRFLLHSSFLVILLGAGVTRYVGYEGIIHIREGKTENRMISQEPYLQIKIKQENGSFYQEYPMEFTALGDNYFEHNITFNNKKLNVKFKDYAFTKKGRDKKATLGIELSLNGESKYIQLQGQRGQKGVSTIEDFGDTIVTLEYGSKVLRLPFSIHLKDFQLDRYPGSMSPSSYASEITVIKENGKKYDYRIFMNRTLHEGNFLFFQSSYDQDELGTVLSVNNDPGKWPTYLGYFLLTLGLVWNLLDKKSRFRKLTKYVSQKNLGGLALFLALALSTNSLQAQSEPEFSSNKYPSTKAYLEAHKKYSAPTAKKFSRLVTQSGMGRMKPLNSLNREIILKLSGKTSLFSLNPDQIVLGMLSRPEIWRNIKMIKIKTPKLKKLLGVEASRKFISFSEVFKKGKYVLQEESNKASMVKPQERGTFEKDILRVDERLNVAYMAYNGNLFKIFPNIKAKEAGSKVLNKWYTPLDAMKDFTGETQKAVETMTRGFINSVIEEKWEKANTYVDLIAQYQKKVGVSVMPDSSEIETEIAFNELDIFPKLTLAYLFLGIIILIAAFIIVFNPSIKARKTTLFFFTILSIIFFIHSFGMGFRWIVSGHAPWSNTYESLLYISWSAVFAGVVFFRKSLLALSGAVIVAAIFMFTAHLTNIDPQITNLVPVLKSYWLTIHVSILTASYGFFGLAAIIAYLSLIIFIFRSKTRPHLDETIKHISAITEIALIIGLSFIAIGNFLGGVWANESWGRYWGWDPKETWAYISIIVYAIVIHLRFVKKFNNPFVLSSAAVLAFATILMTYFGVNFYLSGMHSYATGDPVPVPTWAYVTSIVVLLTIALAYKNRNLKDEICHTKNQK